jgi:DNA-binding XRE family transcriptional regulator
MNSNKRKRLEKAGWKVVTVKELLRLSDAEAALVEVKARLARELRRLRTRLSLTQADVARRVESSQSRVAKMEANDGSTSLDLLVRSLVTLGASPRRIGSVIAGRLSLANPVARRRSSSGRRPTRRSDR